MPEQSLRIQLWSYNYDPEPTGIGPVSTLCARGLRDLGHEVEVVAAHPHYPEPRWGRRLRPYREIRDEIRVLRLPLWIGRASSAERYRQELSFMASQFAALPALGRPDIVVSASPSFPALLPAIVNAGLRNLPWVLWLHDILPDGAAATGLVESGAVLDAARRLEHAAYRKADRIVVLSESFIQNLTAKGVPAHKLELVYDPATRWPDDDAIAGPRAEPPRVLSMGNIGYSQGLAPLVAAFERSRELADRAVRLAITGNGLAADDVRAETRTGRVEMLGLVDDARLEHELRTATIGFVSQHYEGAEFNIPSKLMNFMAYGLPVLAAVDPDSEVARLVRAAKGGWVVDSRTPDAFPEKVAEVLARPAEIEERGAAAREYARRHFSPEGFVSAFANSLAEVVAQRRGTTR